MSGSTPSGSGGGGGGAVSKILTPFSTDITDYEDLTQDIILESTVPFSNVNQSGSWYYGWTSSGHSNCFGANLNSKGQMGLYSYGTATSGYTTFNLGYTPTSDTYVKMALWATYSEINWCNVDVSTNGSSWTTLHVLSKPYSTAGAETPFMLNIGKNRYFRISLNTTVPVGTRDSGARIYYLTTDPNKDVNEPTYNTVSDGNTSNSNSQSGVNPNHIIHTGSNKNVSALAIYPHANTTETQIKIRVSDTSSFTDSQTLRTIPMNKFTNGQWNYVRCNLATGKYIQVYGSSGASKVLELNEVKFLHVTDGGVATQHEHTEIDSTDVVIGLDGV